MRYSFYRFATDLLSPLVTGWLLWRRACGKEDRARFSERFGHPSQPRPEGTLLWLHAASVGEANSVLLLIERLRARFPAINLLLTTGTVTSAQLMQKRLPPQVIHQFAPVDTPAATQRFLRHWKPDIAFWVESEFWPNLVMAARARGCFMTVINGRMSRRSYRGWQRWGTRMMFDMMSCFEVAFAQSEDDGLRLRALGLYDVRYEGNLKFDADLLPCDEAVLFSLQQTLGNRPAWLAASTHDGEEALVAQAHTQLSATQPNLLTIVVPRHPQRGGAIAQLLANHGTVGLRSRGDTITPGTQFYIADTLGELGLFYRLCDIVFIGGSLVPHGGQNPLEAARLRCAVLTGPHTHNFADMVEDMQNAGALLRVGNAAQLADTVGKLITHPDDIAQLQIITRRWLADKGGAAERILNTLAPIFVPVST